MDNILDFSLEQDVRLQALQEYYKVNKDDCFEVGNRICGMYEFNGLRNLENFLHAFCKDDIIVSLFLKFQACKSLLFFSEMKEEISKNDKGDVKEIKLKNNILIEERNNNRLIKAFETLDIFCKQFESASKDDNIPVPCQIEAICMLMKNELYKIESDSYFRKIINNNEVDCDYRYKAILSLEKKDVPYFAFYIKNSCFDFLRNEKNRTMYRILAAQYLLQNCDAEKIEIQDYLLSFAQDAALDYDLRADAADVLLNLGNDEYKTLGRDIIMMLGRAEGGTHTLYDNKQNVHVKEIEKSVFNILSSFAGYEVLKIGANEIDYAWVCAQIEKMLKDEYDCEKCAPGNLTFCSDDCKIIFEKQKKIKTSLNRIQIDRALYLNNTLANITVKLWTYIEKNEFKEEMLKRLLQELEDMSGTCSTGFISRLLNTISGFGDISISISFEDQLIANFTGRLNAYARRITESDSPFYGEKLNDVVELFLNNNNCIKKQITRRLALDLAGGTVNNKVIDACILKIQMKKVIDKYLETEREQKVEMVVEDFSENVLNEMMVQTNKFANRQHFLLFFRTYMLRIREELYEEFKDYMEDTMFDLIIRKAISSYEGLQNMI